jgi:small subunit ribosomal protein S14
MAKTSIKARDRKKEKLIARYAARRKALKEAGDWVALDKLPRSSSPVRLHNRCKMTGRPRGFLRKFGVCRITFRDMASQGKIPGITKSSW